MEILLQTPALNVYEHMALDQVSAERFTEGFILRFYHWASGPAVTFGYAQCAKEVEREIKTRAFTGPFVRRPTGGGVVWHGDDLTFSCVWRAPNRTPSDLYRTLHGAILQQLSAADYAARAFERILPASAYAPSVGQAANQCFVNPVADDLLNLDGQKILGGAIRRFGDKVLYQGSLQAPSARGTPLFKNAILQAVRHQYAPHLSPIAAPEDWVQAARRIAQDVYQTPAWNRKFE